jgi:hypothetical protein
VKQSTLISRYLDSSLLILSLYGRSAPIPYQDLLFPTQEDLKGLALDYRALYLASLEKRLDFAQAYENFALTKFVTRPLRSLRLSR